MREADELQVKELPADPLVEPVDVPTAVLLTDCDADEAPVAVTEGVALAVALPLCEALVVEVGVRKPVWVRV